MNIMYVWNRLLKKARGVAIKDSSIQATSKVGGGSQMVHSSMGKYSYCGYDCKILNCNIGSFCSIADNVIIGGVQHPLGWVSTSPVFYLGRDSIKKKFAEFPRPADLSTTIGNDVWIGNRAIIKAGVHIGDGAVIGTGSVVTKNVGPYEIWAGNPARIIRKRMSDDLIAELLSAKWWEYSDESISDLAKYITEPEEFIKHL